MLASEAGLGLELCSWFRACVNAWLIVVTALTVFGLLGQRCQLFRLVLVDQRINDLVKITLHEVIKLVQG